MLGTLGKEVKGVALCLALSKKAREGKASNPNATFT